MTNFYWPIGKISGELYIGKGAGKRLLRYVGNAQKSVKVFSPYMSASFISTLFDKSEQGLNIKCVTQIVSDTEDKYLSKDTFGLDRIHRRFIKQTTYVNQEKQDEKERREHQPWVMARQLFNKVARQHRHYGNATSARI